MTQVGVSVPHPHCPVPLPSPVFPHWSRASDTGSKPAPKLHRDPPAPRHPKPWALSPWGQGVQGHKGEEPSPRGRQARGHLRAGTGGKMLPAEGTAVAKVRTLSRRGRAKLPPPTSQPRGLCWKSAFCPAWRPHPDLSGGGLPSSSRTGTSCHPGVGKPLLVHVC